MAAELVLQNAVRWDQLGSALIVKGGFALLVHLPLRLPLLGMADLLNLQGQFNELAERCRPYLEAVRFMPEKVKELELEGARIYWDELTCIGYEVTDEMVKIPAYQEKPLSLFL